MKIRFTMIISFLLTILLSSILLSCSKDNNNIRIINDNATGFINVDFYAKNLIRGAYYDNNYAYDDPDCPDSRTVLISNLEQFNSVFSSDATLDIDFQSEMLVVYSYTAINTRNLSIHKSSNIDGIFKIELITEKNISGKDTCIPYQRYVIIKINNTSFNEVEVTIAR